ncbi:hypothetical protein MUK42_33567 [Musa troglodytarum]|uniref:Uncharacterized protein n=1 Tax=Musa troglodytarum TaxID=320322 RepID=A0A9E7FDU6_9LILI|nr:hypothetical protein MUK42_33567 [Musa troglodytarum]
MEKIRCVRARCFVSMITARSYHRRAYGLLLYLLEQLSRLLLFMQSIVGSLTLSCERDESMAVFLDR